MNEQQTLALILAVTAQDFAAAQQLLQQGAVSNRYLSRDFIKSLGADMQQQAVWHTAYDAVVQSGNLDLLRLLLDYGADPNGTAGGRLRPAYLQLLCEKDHFECFKLLLQRGADPNYYSGEGSDTIAAVCQSGKLNYVAELLQHGASLERVLREGLTTHNQAIVELVFKHGLRLRETLPEVLWSLRLRSLLLLWRAVRAVAAEKS